MPTTQINFQHNGHKITAEVVFNLAELKDAVLIIPQEDREDFEGDILLVRFNDRWTTSSNVKKRFPATVKSLLELVNRQFDNHFNEKNLK